MMVPPARLFLCSLVLPFFFFREEREREREERERERERERDNNARGGSLRCFEEFRKLFFPRDINSCISRGK